MISFNPRNKGVPFNEHNIDVSHMSDEGQRELLSLLRSGRCRNGKLRRVDGRRLDPRKGEVYESYTPTADASGRLLP